MSKIKVAVVNTVGKTVSLDPEATKGATLGTNVYLPSGVVGTPTTVRQWLGIGTGEGAFQHADLGGLKAGDDHPQYTMWAARETIKGQWDFVTAVWGANGTAALPEFTFTSDPDTGMYREASDTIGLSAGGTKRWEMSTARVIQQVPFRINNEAGMDIIYPSWRGGIYMEVIPGSNPTADGVGSQIAFWESGPDGSDPFQYGMRIRHTGELNNAGDLDFYRHDNSTAGVLIMRMTRDSDQIQYAVGLASAPSITFLGDLDSGFYLDAANNPAVATGGTRRWVWGTAAHVSYLPVRGVVGSAGTPTWSFDGDTDTGPYRVGADQYGIATGGTNRLTLTSTALTLTVPVQSVVGAATGPTYSFAGDPNTGMYNVGADVLGFAAGGGVRLQLNASGALGLSGANYGTEGQIIVSHGSGAAATWEDNDAGGLYLQPVSNGDPDNPEALFVDGDFVFVEQELL